MGGDRRDLLPLAPREAIGRPEESILDSAVVGSARRLSAIGLRRVRAAAQLLHRPRRMEPVDLVRHLGGVQAQLLPAAGLGLRARTRGLTVQGVARARLEDRSILLTWAMRGTLHLVAAEDYARFVPLVTEPRVANAMRRLKQEGVTGDQRERALGLVEGMLERDGPLTRAEIAQRLSRHGVPTEGQAIAHLLWLAAAERDICHGPIRDGESTFVPVRDWIGRPRAVERDAALEELAVRYLRSHAPARPEDLAAWSGIRVGDAKRAWRAISGRLVEIRAPGGPTWALRSGTDDAPQAVLRLLPAFDEYLLGWRDRGFAVPSEHRTKVNAGGGWLHPVVLADGRVVGTWRAERKHDVARAEIRPFSRLSPAQRKGIASEAEDLASFLGTPVELALTR